MSVPEGSGASPSLHTSLRAFWSVLVAILYTRLDLVTAELEDEAVRGLRLVLTGLFCALSLFVAFFFATYFVIAMFWDNFEHRLIAIGGIFAIYLVTGVMLFNIVRNMISNRPRFLSQTLAELKRDVAGLSKPMHPAKTEAKP